MDDEEDDHTLMTSPWSNDQCSRTSGYKPQRFSSLEVMKNSIREEIVMVLAFFNFWPSGYFLPKQKYVQEPIHN